MIFNYDVSDLQSAINSLNNVVGISQLSDLSLTANHFIQFLANVSVGGITIPKHSRGVLVSSSGSDATLYAIDTSGNLYVSYRNSGTWTNGKNITGDISNITGDISELKTKTTSRSIFSGSGTYRNDIGTAVTLSESVSSHTFLMITCYAGSISSSSKVTIVYPISSMASYYCVTHDGNYNYVRCQADGTSFTLLSSSYSSLYIAGIFLIL